MENHHVVYLFFRLRLHDVPMHENLVVVATGKYIGEEFDSPRLDTLLLAMPISWKGTLAQYAGRLHRNYEGKNEIRIYDYVDVHVPVLERIYHKRMKGYAELGYQIKFGAKDSNVSTIYNGRTGMDFFEKDVVDAVRSVTILSPYVQKSHVSKLLSALQAAVAAGVTVSIHTKDAGSYEASKQPEIDEAIVLLQEIGVQVTTHQMLQQRCAIIDEKIVWYGNVDFLAFGRKDFDVLRFVDSDVAGELIAFLDDSAPEQFVIEDS